MLSRRRFQPRAQLSTRTGDVNNTLYFSYFYIVLNYKNLVKCVCGNTKAFFFFEQGNTKALLYYFWTMFRFWLHVRVVVGVRDFVRMHTIFFYFQRVYFLDPVWTLQQAQVQPKYSLSQAQALFFYLVEAQNFME